MVIILGVLSLGTGLLRLLARGRVDAVPEKRCRKLGLLRFSSSVSIGAGIFLIGLGRSLSKGSRRAWWVTVIINLCLSCFSRVAECEAIKCGPSSDFQVVISCSE